MKYMQRLMSLNNLNKPDNQIDFLGSLTEGKNYGPQVKGLEQDVERLNAMFKQLNNQVNGDDGG